MAAVNAAVSQQLAVLTEQLQQYRPELAAAVQFGIVASSIINHAQAARQAGWTVPLVGLDEQQAGGANDADSSSSSSSSTTKVDIESSCNATSSSRDGETAVKDPGRFFLRGVWPYWMSCKDVSTVSNDVQLEGLMLLTGPNMAGEGQKRVADLLHPDC